MRIITSILSTMLFIVAIFFVGGFLIPAEWMVSRTITIHASPEQIYPLVSNFKEWEKWSPWNASKDATLQYQYTGPSVGVGAKQSWTSKTMGNGWMQFTKADPKKGVAYDLFIDMDHSESMLHGNIDFIPMGDVTKINWTDRGNSGDSFIKRWMSLMVKLMIGKDLETALIGLKSQAEET